MTIRLELSGEHTRLHSSLCYECPHGMTGCCASPPGVDWSDIGRIVTLGGRDWLLEQLEAGNLRTGARGLLLKRVANDQGNAGTWPTKCVYHGPQGCTIPPDRRAATCNYYICDDAFLYGGENQGNADAVTGREAHAVLMALYGRWDLEVLAKVEERWPGGPPWDAAFLDWVGEEYRRLVKRDRRDLKGLRA
ncbi:MAG TPA: hypothetical protein VK464_20760 [Symbiobacteriaceae bacterium]|jgi:hypothetical protein|nr:hypothetical protein [Symbiobacteriaceae bacterium]